MKRLSIFLIATMIGSAALVLPANAQHITCLTGSVFDGPYADGPDCFVNNANQGTGGVYIAPVPPADPVVIPPADPVVTPPVDPVDPPVDPVDPPVDPVDPPVDPVDPPVDPVDPPVDPVDPPVDPVDPPVDPVDPPTSFGGPMSDLPADYQGAAPGNYENIQLPAGTYGGQEFGGGPVNGTVNADGTYSFTPAAA